MYFMITIFQYCFTGAKLYFWFNWTWGFSTKWCLPRTYWKTVDGTKTETGNSLYWGTSLSVLWKWDVPVTFHIQYDPRDIHLSSFSTATNYYLTTSTEHCSRPTCVSRAKCFFLLLHQTTIVDRRRMHSFWIWTRITKWNSCWNLISFIIQFSLIYYWI